MSRTYEPDSWAIVLIESEEHGKVYKVLASWYGGFTQGDSWKLSSGIESVSFKGDHYTMPQSSGSVYILHKNNEHISGIMGSVFSSFAAGAEEGKYTIKLIELEELLAAFQ